MGPRVSKIAKMATIAGYMTKFLIMGGAAGALPSG